MSGPVPPILWYLLAFLALAVFPLTMVWAIHRTKMKALEILRFYAEKGGEPPATVTELLTRQFTAPDQKWKSTPQGALLHNFGMHLWMACLFGGIAWWRIEAGPPQWAVYAAVCSTVFFGVLALGHLFAALRSSPK